MGCPIVSRVQTPMAIGVAVIFRHFAGCDGFSILSRANFQRCDKLRGPRLDTATSTSAVLTANVSGVVSSILSKRRENSISAASPLTRTDAMIFAKPPRSTSSEIFAFGRQECCKSFQQKPVFGRSEPLSHSPNSSNARASASLLAGPMQRQGPPNCALDALDIKAHRSAHRQKN
jgi:hypothetical protein